MNRTCNRCKLNKKLSDYRIDRKGKQQRASICKSCTNKKDTARRRSREGLIYRLYEKQKDSSVNRNHPPPEYSLNELVEWVLSRDNFEFLFNAWVKSNYNSKLRPSIDRLDDYKHYTFDNIQLVTWEYNYTKSHRDVREGRNTKKTIAVLQLDLNNNLITEHYSIRSAERKTGICSSIISRACKYNLSGKGYIWEYKK